MDGIDTWMGALAAGPWALPAMALLVFGDAFLVVVPGEVAVTAFGALAATDGPLPLAAVVAVAAAAAVAGDACCYALGRSAGLERWRWMRRPRVRAALDEARGRLERRTAVVLFTARFVPFARLAVNLTAGAARVPAPRYLGVAAVAALGWAAYQALIGAVISAILPGGPVAAVIVSVGVAIAIGLGIDVVLARRSARR